MNKRMNDNSNHEITIDLQDLLLIMNDFICISYSYELL